MRARRLPHQNHCLRHRCPAWRVPQVHERNADVRDDPSQDRRGVHLPDPAGEAHPRSPAILLRAGSRNEQRTLLRLPRRRIPAHVAHDDAGGDQAVHHRLGINLAVHHIMSAAQ